MASKACRRMPYEDKIALRVAAQGWGYGGKASHQLPVNSQRLIPQFPANKKARKAGFGELAPWGIPVIRELAGRKAIVVTRNVRLSVISSGLVCWSPVYHQEPRR